MSLTTVETSPPGTIELESYPYHELDRISTSVPGASQPKTSTKLTNAPLRIPDVVQPSPPTEPEAEATTQKLSGTAIAVLMIPLCLCHFLSSLDFTIITPAIPSIVSSFSSSTGYVWIGSAFILSSTAITPVWGSVADIWGRKSILLIALAIFLGGSLLCALAPSMKMLVAGRAVQGLGSSGMGTMVNVVICDSFSLRERGLYFAVTSGVWAVGSSIGPVIGGAFTKGLGWRWCFWINMPIGAVVFIVLLFSLKVPSPETPILVGLKAIDWTGSVLIIGAALMILLGLDFGDVAFPWSSATVISLIVAGLVTLTLFVGNEWKLATNPVIPMRLFSNKSIVAAYITWACNFSVLVGLSYYLPLYSQSVFGADALTSGVHLIPLVVSCSLSAVGVGTFIQKTGVYLPITYIAHALLVLGTGLLINLKPSESIAKMVVCEILIGTGVGMNLDPPLLAVQASLSVLDTAAIQATMTFLRSLATTVSIVVGGVIFQNQMNGASRDMTDQLGEKVAGMFSGDHAAASVELLRSLPAEQREVVKDAYFISLKSVWIMLVVVAAVSSIANFFLRAHHLDDESQAAVLGVDRAKRSERQPHELRQAQSVDIHQQENRTG